MKIRFTESAIKAGKDIPPDVKKAFEKQLRFLAANLSHPSLHAKKYNEAEDEW